MALVDKSKQKRAEALASRTATGSTATTGPSRHLARIPSILESTCDARLIDERATWSAVLSMALCVVVLIASEFMPARLLVAGLACRIDRRPVVAGFAVLLILSGPAMAFDPVCLFLIVGQAMPGPVTHLLVAWGFFGTERPYNLCY